MRLLYMESKDRSSCLTGFLTTVTHTPPPPKMTSAKSLPLIHLPLLGGRSETSVPLPMVSEHRARGLPPNSCAQVGCHDHQVSPG